MSTLLTGWLLVRVSRGVPTGQEPCRPARQQLLQYLLGHTVRVSGVATSNGTMMSPPAWRVGVAGLITGLAGGGDVPRLDGAITRAVAAEAAGQDPSLEQSYRFGFHRFWSVLAVSVLVGLAVVGGLILFIIPVSGSASGWRPAPRRW